MNDQEPLTSVGLRLAGTRRIIRRKAEGGEERRRKGWEREAAPDLYLGVSAYVARELRGLKNRVQQSPVLHVLKCRVPGYRRKVRKEC